METDRFYETKTVRDWTFTLNNYVEEEIQKIREVSSRYYIIGRETGANGTPHLQGYIYFAREKSLRQLKKLSPRAHWENAIGDAKQNFVYCSKEGNFEERGVMPLTQAEKGLKGAAKYEEMYRLAIAGDYRKLPPGGIKTWEYIHVKFAQAPKPREKLENLWIHGKSGCGKSRWIRENYPEGIFYSKPMSKWWDGYAGQDVIVLDDFDPKHAEFLTYFLKIWADHYPFQAEVKGGMLCIRPKTVIITSQYTMEQCWAADEESLSAIRRRFQSLHLNPLNSPSGRCLVTFVNGELTYPEIPDIQVEQEADTQELPNVYVPGFFPGPIGERSDP